MKRTSLYTVFSAIFFVVAYVGTVAVCILRLLTTQTPVSDGLVIAAALLVSLVLPLPTLVHEVGHLVFGLAVGFRFYSVCVSRIRIEKRGRKLSVRLLGKNEHAGSCEMLPKSGDGVKGRTIAFALGGAVFNLIYAAVFTLLYFLAPPSGVLFFFELFTLFHIAEAFSALLPVPSPTGLTDGAFVLGLIKNERLSVATLCVMTAQGTVAAQGYRSLGRERLFDLPVVAEDEPVFLALLQLRYRYFTVTGEREEAAKWVNRMASLEIPESASEEVGCELDVFCRLLGAPSVSGPRERNERPPDSFLSRMAAWAADRTGAQEKLEEAKTLLDGDEGTRQYYTALYDWATEISGLEPKV